MRKKKTEVREEKKGPVHVDDLLQSINSRLHGGVAVREVREVNMKERRWSWSASRTATLQQTMEIKSKTDRVSSFDVHELEKYARSQGFLAPGEYIVTE